MAQLVRFRLFPYSVYFFFNPVIGQEEMPFATHALGLQIGVTLFYNCRQSASRRLVVTGFKCT